MSITSDIRAYADKAVNSAQAQLNDVTGQANEFVGKLTAPVKENVTELRGKAEKAINLDAIKNAVEPYLDQVKGYRATVTERAEALLEQVRNDKRVKQLVDTVVDAVQERVVKPVRTLTNRGAKPAAPKPAAKAAPAKPVAAKAAPAKAAAKPASKPAARKAPAKKATKKA